MSNKSRLYYLRSNKLSKSNNVIENPLVRTALEVLDGKEAVSESLVKRLKNHLVEGCGIESDLAKDYIARSMGHVTFARMAGCTTTEEALKSTLEKRKDQAKLRKKQENAQKLKDLHRGTARAKDIQPLWEYFFFKKTEYMESIEKLMEDYTDTYIQKAVNNYPQEKMSWEEYRRSFGLFWNTVIKKAVSGEIDFSEPGLERIKRLAHYLFSWNFRRYLESEVIFRYARFLPNAYRASHVAAHRDKDNVVVMDEVYPELNCDDDTDNE